MLGGQIAEPPYITGGDDTAQQAMSYVADMAFFSVGGASAEGEIYDGAGYFNMHKAMLMRSEKTIFLVDHEKIGQHGTRVLGDFSRVNTVISDYDFSNEIKEKFPNTQFLKIETPKTQK